MPEGYVLISKSIQQEVLDGYGLKPIEASELLSSYQELLAERNLYRTKFSEAIEVHREQAAEIVHLATGVCACFVTKPCPYCNGSGKAYCLCEDCSPPCAPQACTQCEGIGRKRLPKCAKCREGSL